MSVRRGEVVWVRLGLGEGSEQQKTRPGIVVSNQAVNDSASRHQRGVVTVIPMTSSRTVPLHHQVAAPRLATGLSRDGVAQTEQVRAVDISRVVGTNRVLDSEVMRALERSLALHFDLS